MIALYATAAFVVMPEMYSDPAYGFLVWDSMMRGAAFNHAVRPDLADIARDASEFLTVWSPGQYVFPGILQAFGATIGVSMNIVSTVATALGLWGWYRLYRSWAFPATSAAVAIAITGGSRYVALPFGIYNGGEVLLFGALPWFLLLLGRWSSLSPAQAAGLFAAVVGVAFMKLSGIVFAFAALGAITVYDLVPLRHIQWRRPLTVAAMAVVFAGLLYWLWLSQGWTPVAPKRGSTWHLLLPRFAESFAAAVMGMFSLGDLAKRFLLFPGQKVLQDIDHIYLAASIPAAALLVWAGRRLRASHPDYLRFVGATALMFIAALALVYGNGGELDMEDRHFRPVSLILLIGIVHAVAGMRGAIRLPLAAIAAATVLYGMSSYVVRLQHNMRMPLSARGFHHGNLTADGLALLREELAKPRPADTIAWVMMPEIALEIPQVRTIVSAEPERLLGARNYKGKASRLLVLVDDKMVRDGRVEIVLKSFVDYDRNKWVARQMGDTTVFMQ